jgi:hypothetical protein
MLSVLRRSLPNTYMAVSVRRAHGDVAIELNLVKYVPVPRSSIRKSDIDGIVQSISPWLNLVRWQLS